MFVLSSSKFIPALMTNMTQSTFLFFVVSLEGERKREGKREKESCSVVKLHWEYATLRKTAPSRSAERKVSDISMRYLHGKYLLYNVCTLAIYKRITRNHKKTRNGTVVDQ